MRAPPILMTWPIGAPPAAWIRTLIEPLGLDLLRRRTGPIGIAGTWPLGIALPDSDLDVLLEATDLAGLRLECDSRFGGWPGYRARMTDRFDAPALVVRLPGKPVDIEIFAQSRPVTDQTAYRHMIAEGRLLQIGGAGLADRVRALKRTGLKTEPAFARALGLFGDPYRAVLALENQPEAMLRALLSKPPDGL